MKFIALRRSIAATAFATFLPMLVAAQTAGSNMTSDPVELERMFAEYQRVHMELEGIQQIALADPDLSALQEELGEEIQRAMEALDPTMKEWMARASVVEAEAHAMQQAGDTMRAEELIAERDALSDRFFALQQRVVSEPEFAVKIAGFQQSVQTRMLEVDPRTVDFIGRLRELEMVLRAASARSEAGRP